MNNKDRRPSSSLWMSHIITFTHGHRHRRTDEYYEKEREIRWQQTEIIVCAKRMAHKSHHKIFLKTRNQKRFTIFLTANGRWFLWRNGKITHHMRDTHFLLRRFFFSFVNDKSLLFALRFLSPTRKKSNSNFDLLLTHSTHTHTDFVVYVILAINQVCGGDTDTSEISVKWTFSYLFSDLNSSTHTLWGTHRTGEFVSFLIENGNRTHRMRALQFTLRFRCTFSPFVERRKSMTVVGI